jgi:hypothetical protein
VDDEEGDRRQQVAERVALLQQAGVEAALGATSTAE